MNTLNTKPLRSLNLITILLLSMILVPTALARGKNASLTSQNKQDFTLHNETGLEIKEVYVSESGNDDWEEDILGKDTLDSGGTVDITFHRKRADNWDIKIVFSNGKSNFWRKLNLSQITDVTISFKHGQPWATWKNGDQ